MSAKFEGTVKWFNEEKGFGFIKQEGTNDIFLHISQVEGPEMPDTGDTVSYYPEEGKKGMVATKVIIVRKADKDQNHRGGHGGHRRDNRRQRTERRTSRDGQSFLRRFFEPGFQPA